MKVYSFTLGLTPMPTTNRNMIVHPKGKRPMVIKTAGAKQWMEEAIYLMRDFRAKQMVRPIDEPVSVCVDVYRKLDSGDIDNYAKGVLDALQASGILTNDRLVEELTLRKWVDRKRPRYHITIATLNRVNVQEFPFDRFPSNDEQ